MVARSVWLGQEEHGSVRAGGEDVMSDFWKVKWLESLILLPLQNFI